MAFQEMCRDLLELEPGIKTCDIYGTPGQSQSGIDIKALVQEGYGCEVGQCKCTGDFPPAEIRKASEEFLKHLSFWQEKNVRRFILFVASPLDKRQQQDEIDSQAKHFASLGINYEPWSSRTLRTKLRHRPEIVLRYTRSQEWVEIICGRTFDPALFNVDRSTGIIDSLLNSQANLSSGLSKELEKKVEDIRELYYRGKIHKAYECIDELHQDPNWRFLEKTLRARILRLKAAYTLELKPDLNGAMALAEEASHLDPASDDSGTRALISYYDKGAEATLAIVDRPATVHALNLKIGLLLQAERISDALDAVTNPPPNVMADAETRRLHALALLAGREVQSARKLIMQLTAEHPHREHVRFDSARIKYFSCLSPAALPPRLVVWPHPESWQLVKKDDQSLDLLREAEREFESLARESERGDDRRRVLETWRLACLAIDATRQAEAGEFCRSLLEREPTHHRALSWALAHNFEVDLEASVTPLEELTASFEGIRELQHLEQILALAGLYLRLGRIEQARGLLRKWEDEFNKASAGHVWRFWMGQVLVNARELEEALKFAQSERDPTLRRSLMLSALRAEAVHSGDWRPHVRYLEKSFRRTKDGEYLFELCWVKARQEDWPYLVEQAEALVESVMTADAVRLAAGSLWNGRHLKKCLRLLNKYEHLFPGGVLPGDLWRIRVGCEIKTGSPQAVADAQELVRHDQAAENILSLIHAQVSGADLKGAVMAARPLLHRRHDVQPLDLIRVAKWIRSEDTTLAGELLRRAIPHVLDDPTHLGVALQVGFSLGLDNELGSLMERAQEFSARGKGPLTLKTLSEARALRKQELRRLQEVQRHYERGEIPAHYCVGEFGTALADYLHGIPKLHRECVNPLAQLRVFTRHGGRPLDEDLLATCHQWRLHLDVSALMLASDLGILERVEECFQPLYIPASLLNDLRCQRDTLAHPQPAQITNYRKVLDLLQDGRLHPFPNLSAEAEPFKVSDIGASLGYSDASEKMGDEWLALLLHARAENGFVVDFLPLRGRTLERELVALPPQLNAHVVNCRALAESMRNSGHLPGPRYGQALDALGTEAAVVEPQVIPQAGSKLFLNESIASVLARADLLDAICQHFEVCVDPAHIAAARRQVRENNRIRELDGWLERLADHVRSRREEGVYRQVALSDETLQVKLRDEEEEDAPVTSLADLMLYDFQEADVLWVDDRFVNGFSRRETVPIIGVNEVLAALRSRGELSEDEYYYQLLMLRASNFRYVPLAAEEITHHLQNAEVSEEGDVRESWELSVLRRYVAACLLDVNQLQRPPLPEGSPNPAGELAFIFGLVRAAEGAMIQTWADETISVDIAQARSDWILRNLYTGGSGIRHLLPNSEARGDAVDLVGLDIGGTLAHAGLGIGGFERLSNPNSERRKKFIAWFENRVFFRHLRTDAGVQAAAVRWLERIIGEAAAGEYSEGEPLQELAVRVRMSQLYSDLPEELTDAMSLSPEALDWIGVKVFQAARVGSMHFEVSDYTEAARRAMAGEAATIRAQDESDEDEYTFRKASQPEGEEVISPMLEIYRRDGTLAGRVSDPFLSLLSANHSEREEVLRRHRSWFDCEQSLLDREIKEIVTTSDPRARADRVKKWWGESAEFFYRELEEQIAKRREFLWAGLTPPSAGGLLRHFRLPALVVEGESFSEAIRQSAVTLLREEGLTAALDRLSRLPIRIPDPAIGELSGLAAAERNKLLARWFELWASPLSRLHLVDLILRSSPGDEAAARIARDALADLFNDESGNSHFQLFDALLDFVNKEFGYWPETAGWLPPVRLAMVWAHACKLHNIFSAAGAIPEALAKTFRAENRHLGADILSRDPAYWNDVLHPHRLKRAFFLTHAVARALADIPREALEAVGALELVRARAMRKAGELEVQVPVAEFFIDTALAENSTGSFLGGDRGETLKPYLGEDIARWLSSGQMEELVQSAVSSLENDPNQRSWATIEAVVGDLPLYAGLRERFAALLGGLNMEAMLKVDPLAARYALRSAAHQMWNIPDESLRTRCEAALLTLTEFQARSHSQMASKADSDDEAPDEAMISELIEIVTRLALRPNDPRATSRSFTRLLEQMVKAWPSLGDNVGYAASKLVFELPARQLHGMWPLLLYLRASHPRAL
jgi:hypothetical protein